MLESLQCEAMERGIIEDEPWCSGDQVQQLIPFCCALILLIGLKGTTRRLLQSAVMERGMVQGRDGDGWDCGTQCSKLSVNMSASCWRKEIAGASQVVWVPKEKVPLMVRKSDGGFGYGTTDMATLRQRIQVAPCCHAAVLPMLQCF